jgi:hypothetical protein
MFSEGADRHNILRLFEPLGPCHRSQWHPYIFELPAKIQDRQAVWDTLSVGSCGFGETVSIFSELGVLPVSQLHDSIFL